MQFFTNRQLLKGFIPSLLLFGQCQPGEESGRPNIVIILADDLGWADVGYNGSGYYETPNIDRLAEEGMVFSRFYPSAANCAPSRASLLTGMYSPRHGVYLPQGLSRGGEVSKMRWKVPTHGQDSTFNTFPVSINHVDPSFESLAEMLKRGGYVTARLGKWHIGDDNQGFDLSSANGTPGFITNINGLEERFYSDTLVAEKLTDAAIEFISANRDGPFFVYLSHWEVHTPMAARKERVDCYTARKENQRFTNLDPVYAAEVEQLDISLGRVMDALRELGLEKNTLLIFTSDNGGLANLTSNEPLRAGKGSFYEGGIRVPFVARWPAVIKPGSQTDAPVSGIDFMPTFAEMAGVRVPQHQPVDGISILPLFREDKWPDKRSLFFHFPLYLGGENGKNQFLPVYRSNEYLWRAVPSTTIMKGDWKLIYYYEYESYELFNLREDISEKNDLSEKEPGIARELLSELKNWVRDVQAPVPDVPNDLFEEMLDHGKMIRPGSSVKAGERVLF